MKDATLACCHDCILQEFEKQSRSFLGFVRSLNADAALGTKSWLTSSIAEYEVFLGNLNVYRKDRGAIGDGVFILLRGSLHTTLLNVPVNLTKLVLESRNTRK